MKNQVKNSDQLNVQGLTVLIGVVFGAITAAVASGTFVGILIGAVIGLVTAIIFNTALLPQKPHDR